MINLGTGDIFVLDDDWTVVTRDEKVSAHWEHTVAVVNGKTEVLTDPLEEFTLNSKVPYTQPPLP